MKEKIYWITIYVLFLLWVIILLFDLIPFDKIIKSGLIIIMVTLFVIGDGGNKNV